MSDNYRKERVERLLTELKYEITRGMMEGEIEESLGFTFAVPVSKTLPNGVVWCEFRTRPTVSGLWMSQPGEPRLKVVK